MRFLIVSLLITTLTNAFADEQINLLEKGAPAPYSGYLFSQEAAEKVRHNKLDLDSERKVNSLMKENELIYLQRLQDSREHIDGMSKQLVEQRDNSLLSKIGMFVLGAGITGAISYGLFSVTHGK